MTRELKACAPDWLNAETCISNAEIAYEDSIEDEDGPVDTVISSGDLGVVIGLAKHALAMRSSLPNPEGMTEALAQKIENYLRSVGWANDDLDYEAFAAALSTRSEGQVTEARTVVPCEGSVMHSDQAVHGQRWCLAAGRYCKHATGQSCVALASTRVEPDGCPLCDDPGCPRNEAAAPDEDAEFLLNLSFLSDGGDRQAIRDRIERIAERISSRDGGLRPLLANIAQMLDEMRTERQNGSGLPWTDWNQQQRDEISRILGDRP